MSIYPLSSSQTVGPFFHDGLLRPGVQRDVLVTPTTVGQRIQIVGRVLDGDAAPIADALVEIWQANHFGRYNHPSDTRDLPLDPEFIGFGRTGTDADGVYRFVTIKPGPVPFDADLMQAPHICVAVFARGLLNHAMTRLYFADDPAIASDPLLSLLPTARRPTLLAMPDPYEAGLYHFDLVLQGDGETVFFNI